MKRDDGLCDCKVIHEDIVGKVAPQMPKDNTPYRLADFFKVLGDGTRVKVLWALSIHPMCVCDLAALLNMTKSAVSHQLRALRQAKLVKSTRMGKVVFYAPDDDHVSKVFQMGLAHIREGP